MPDAQYEQTNTFFWLLSAGGLPLLGLGLLLAAIGIVLIIWPLRRASFVLVLLSILPAVLGLITVYSAAVDYGEMAGLSTPPKPAEFAAATSRAMSSSFFGLLGTIVALIPSLAAVARATNPARALKGTPQVNSPH
ncbi:hypothetical protein FYK55_12755 [Roseiconus nitratireducens]|uniref:Uncharacterized protein n=1 Tax=Roseiconus nitratireducens TaxID=2605748 RepID=A0A5M6D6I5_9BACT|nr:hypothetical protein [Roseiconus nitratireducens]KAA5543147.1 hypothetical protein FYK55_12755 [Roseiconus nitratireducens]